MSPNAEDLNFLLGSTVHRGRNAATASTAKSPAVETQHREVTRSASEGKITPVVAATNRNEAPTNGAPVCSKPVSRKKSAPLSSQPIIIANNDTPVAVEELFMDVVLQRHVRRMLSTGIVHLSSFLIRNMMYFIPCFIIALPSKPNVRH